ncbi:MAG: hypothetical protein QM756_34635 [Polyangiaceae bacterium]
MPASGAALRDPRVDALQRSMRDQALNRLSAMALPAQGERDADRALCQLPHDKHVFLALAALDAQLAPETAGLRLAAAWTLAAAVNLMDDLADGDCTYLPLSAAPSVVVLLLGLSTQLASEGGVGQLGLAASAEGLVRMAAGQSTEVRTSTWSEESYRVVADQIGGYQYFAYLSLVWEGTFLSSAVRDVSLCVGRAGMVARDIRTGDRRFFTMSEPDRAGVVAWARDALQLLEARGLGSLRLLDGYARPVLETWSTRVDTCRDSVSRRSAG